MNNKIIFLLAVAVLTVVSIGAYAQISSSGEGLTVTATVNNTGAPSGCAYASFASAQGFKLEMDTNPIPKAGGIICLNFKLTNISNSTTPPLSTESVTVRGSDGLTYFAAAFADVSGSGLAPSQAWYTTAYWDTTQSFNGTTIIPGNYHVFVQVDVAGAEVGYSFALAIS